MSRAGRARRIFIGDIQGCRAQLDALLEAVGFATGDRLYCAGDLVNRGPDSLGVLRKLKNLAARVVLGNHDMKLLRVAAGADAPSREDNFQPVLEARDASSLTEWLASQAVMHVEPDLVLVHAGLHPKWRDDIESIAKKLNAALPRHLRGHVDRRIEFATVVRHCDADGRRPEIDDPPPGPPFEPWDRFYVGHRMVVFGHWARRGLVVGKRVRGLDTGCVYGGALTAWVAEEDRIVQVPGWRRPS
jgi:bis(5'-nucleosyl)-tetraphosphatase (symmetrical)